MSERRLILLRHATSPLTGHSDHKRTLSEAGEREAESIAAQLEAEWWPQVALVSDAARTRETWERVMASTDHPHPETLFLEELYQAGLDCILSVLEDLDAANRTVMVLAHNPGISETASWMSGIRVGMGTANAALLHHPTTAQWASVSGSGGDWKLVEFLRPHSGGA